MNSFNENGSVRGGRAYHAPEDHRPWMMNQTVCTAVPSGRVYWLSPSSVEKENHADATAMSSRDSIVSLDHRTVGRMQARPSQELAVALVFGA